MAIIRQYFTQQADSYSLIKSNNPDISLFSLIFEWNTRTQDVINNTSTIDWAFKIETYDLNRWEGTTLFAGDEVSLTIDGWGDESVPGIRVKINGEEVVNEPDGTTTVASNQLVTLASGEYIKVHNSDGTLSMSASGLARIKSFSDGEGEVTGSPDQAVSVSTQITPNAIPRHAVIQSAPNFNDEENPTITFAIPDGATNVKAYIALDGETQSIAARSISGSSYTFNFTQSEREVLWSILNGGYDTKQIRFYVISDFNGTTYKTYLTRTLTIVNYTPTLNPEVYDTVSDIVDRLTGNKYILVKYASKPYFSTGAKARKGATIDTQSVKNGETTLHSASGTFDYVTNNLFSFAATDSFGRNVSAEREFSRPNYFIDYVKLTCSVSVSEMTADGDVAVTIKGKYFDGSFGKRANSMRMHYDIAKNNGDPENVDMGYIYPTVDDDANYSYTFTITGLDYQSVYDLTVRVTDEISKEEPTEANVIVASTPIFDWGRTDFNFNVPVTIQGWQVDTIVEESNSEMGFYYDSEGLPQMGGYEWSFRKWSSGLLECWCSIELTTNVSGTWGGLYTSGKLDKTNLIFPRTFAETPVVVATLAPNYAGGLLMTTGSGSTPVDNQATGPFEIARGGSYTNATYTINYIVKGKWK